MIKRGGDEAGGTWHAATGQPASPQTAQGRRAGELRQMLPEKRPPGSHDRRSSVTARVSLVMRVESGGWWRAEWEMQELDSQCRPLQTE